MYNYEEQIDKIVRFVKPVDETDFLIGFTTALADGDTKEEGLSVARGYIVGYMHASRSALKVLVRVNVNN